MLSKRPFWPNFLISDQLGISQMKVLLVLKLRCYDDRRRDAVLVRCEYFHVLLERHAKVRQLLGVLRVQCPSPQTNSPSEMLHRTWYSMMRLSDFRPSSCGQITLVQANLKSRGKVLDEIILNLYTELLRCLKRLQHHVDLDMRCFSSLGFLLWCHGHHLSTHPQSRVSYLVSC